MKKGKFGDFYCCSEYPSCKTIFIKEENGFKVKQSSGKSSGEKCVICKKGDIITRNGANGEWHSCNRYPSCKTTYEKNGNKFTVKKKGQFNKKAKDNTSDNGETNKEVNDLLEE
jgi:ssDNA-binding Zn-finger/Zn-ribbon topoisomerase 1